MQSVMALLTDKHQPVVGAICLSRMTTAWARLGGVVGIHVDCHTLVQEGFVRNHRVQLGKAPGGVSRICLALLDARLFAFPSLCALADVRQVFQSNHTLWVLGHNMLADDVVGVLLQPSLSPTDAHQTARGGTSAFLLKTLSQSCIMIALGTMRLPE